MPIEILSDFVSIVIASFLGIHFLFLGTRSNRANTFLGTFLVLTAISVLGSGTDLIPDLHRQIRPFGRLMALCSSFLFAPILFYYSLAITNSLAAKGKKYLWVFIPAIVDIILHLIFYLQEDFALLSTLASSLFSLVIYYLTIREIKDHNRNILSEFSAIEDKRLSWLKMLVAVNIGFTILWLLDDSLFWVLGGNPVSDVLAAISLFATLITVLWIGFAGLRQNPIYAPPPYLKGKEELEPKLEAEGATMVDAELRLAEVSQLMEAERMYLDHDLSLTSLARKLGFKNKELSQIINQGFGENFYHYVNRFRVQHFKAMMQDEAFRNMSIDGLSSECGFKSKSTFYAAFKKVEGMTPKQYELRQK